ncbi:hypothetical protein [Pectobacterium polaris]|uniref:hypothetical protein n=1 Tax=Pectobacterium polaris TaxID=2042057 RepID=UPI000F8E81B9|nr:hypothetical protein [Pectobacterium polaris]RUR93132.1 hypothetical protein KHDHEBDM_03338 [Pectobacterium polaris]
MTLASLTEQNMSQYQHQQLLTLEDKNLVGININCRWAKFVAGFTLVNMLILAGMATVFIIKLGV